jgi:hypothetical protein
MSLREKALEMRNVIDEIELALSSMNGFEDLAPRWDGARNDLIVKVDITVGQVRRIRDAYVKLNDIINSPEYTPANLDS